MPNSANSLKRLPDKPSEEHLRKEAKRLAKVHEMRLSDAQYRLALGYGHRTWSELMKAVRTARQQPTVAGTVCQGIIFEIVSQDAPSLRPVIIGTESAREDLDRPCLPSTGWRRRSRARMLAEIYNWLTEGFDTSDLKDAEALLTR